MRFFCLIVLAIVLNWNCYSQKHVHGFLEIRFIKEADGSLCDYGWNYFCYELNNETKRDSLVNTIITRESLGESVVFLINKEKPIDFEITDSIINVKKLPPVCNYYSKSDSRYVYALYEIMGYACDIKLSTSEMLYNEEIMQIAHYAVDKTKQSFGAYYFYNLYHAECIKVTNSCY